jgi:deoxyribonuclease (pyrimidine dimer)
MTRVNAGIKPKELSDAMLFAEYREIKRIPNKVKNGKYNFKNEAPTEFTLNIGHELFFRDKLLYLKKKSDSLYQECLLRQINAEDYSDAYENLPTHLFNDWNETDKARELLKERINERLTESKAIVRYNKQIVEKRLLMFKLEEDGK